jgi:putative membrane protein
MMLKSTVTGLGCVLVLSLPALAQTKAANNADRAIIWMAAVADMTEAHIGQMAENQASESQVKDLAQKLIHDHTDAYQQLAAVAVKNGDSVPAGIDVRKITAVEQLMKLKGAQFDRVFVQEEIRDHERAIAEFKREAQHGQNPDVKAYASKMIPVLEDHLRLAQALAKPGKHNKRG